MSLFPRIRSTLLSQFPNIVFAMSTRQGAEPNAPFGFNLGFNVGDDEARVEQQLTTFLAEFALSPDEVAFMEQVHDVHIAFAEKPGVYTDTDAIVTRTPELALAIRVADCLPIVLYVPSEGLIAGIHAGWKGTAKQITTKTVQYLVDEYNVRASEVFAYIGPGAAACCYEVSAEVAALFPDSCVTARATGNPKLDLHKANVHQLLGAGLPEENIETDATCTICNSSLFHSHRRDGATSGRMLAITYLKEET